MAKLQLKTTNKMDTPNNQLTIGETYKQFMATKSIDLRPATLKNYQDFVGAFVEWIGSDTIISQLNVKVINEFILHLQTNTSCNGNSINAYLRHIRTYINYLIDLDLINKFKIKMLRVDKKPKATYTQDEIRMMLREPLNPTLTDIRNITAIFILYGTGIRLDNLVNLKKSNINLKGKYIELETTKNRKSLKLPIPNALVKAIERYNELMPDIDHHDYFFFTDSGGVISKNGLYNGVKRFVKRLGIEWKSLHSFRHTFALELLKSKTDLYLIKELLGHSNVTTTQAYLQGLTSDDLLQIKYKNPLENL